MSEEELQQDDAAALAAETTDDSSLDAAEVQASGEGFGQDSDVDGTDSEGDAEVAESSGAGDGAFDVDQLPAIEANYDDEAINDLIRRALNPISPEAPCGQDEGDAESVISQIETTSDSIHESLRSDFGEAVRDDTTLTFDIASSGRDASDLIEQIIECLETKCKSSILASNLPHLMLIEYGLPGFSAGLEIVRELIARFEGHLFPRDEERLKNYLRRGVYVGNDDKVTDNFKLFLYQPITEHNRLPYALLRNSRVRGANTEVEGKYATDAANSSVAFYVKFIGDLEHLIETARSTNAQLHEKLADPMCEIVSYSFADSLERMCTIVKSLATENCSGYPPVEVEDSEQEEAGESGVKAAAAMTGEIVDREQAIDLLRRIADFFHRTERHSPVSYRIRETIRWCQMDLPELLQELLSDDQGPLDELQKRVGFKRNDEYGGGDSDYDG